VERTRFPVLSFDEIKESLTFSARSLMVNKLRTFLSLLGVTIGIFAIIMVFSLVDSMEKSIRDTVSTLGDDLVFVEKWPMTIEEGETEYPWWKYWQRPEPSPKDLKVLLERLRTAQDGTFKTEFQADLSYGNSSVERGYVMLCDQAFERVYPLKIEKGRFFTQGEDQMGRAVCIIGADVNESLFGSLDALGRIIKVKGRKAEVIGVMEREGESMLGDNVDDVIIVPLNFGRQLVDITQTQNTLMVKANSGVSNIELKDDITGVLRNIHRLRPSEEKDFALNEMSIVANLLDGIFGFFKTVALVIGMFSILVGGFGIANIMFVSVRERTSIIGIQKALGAKQAFILLQFLFESVLLSLIGGIIALLIIYLLTLILTNAFGFDIFLGMNNVMIGIGITLVIGVIAGIVPAYRASRLDPVEAIRST
jgi:putative ABC transport system permease protein